MEIKCLKNVEIMITINVYTLLLHTGNSKDYVKKSNRKLFRFGRSSTVTQKNSSIHCTVRVQLKESSSCSSQWPACGSYVSGRHTTVAGTLVVVHRSLWQPVHAFFYRCNHNCSAVSKNFNWMLVRHAFRRLFTANLNLPPIYRRSSPSPIHS